MIIKKIIMRVNLIKIIPIQVDPLVILKRAMKDVATEENGLTFEDDDEKEYLIDYISDNLDTLIDEEYPNITNDCDDYDFDSDDLDELEEEIYKMIKE